MRAQDLPFEICLQIFQQISQSKAYICMTVCKSWHQAAVQAYYEELTLSGKEKLIFLKKKLQLEDSEQDQQFLNCKWTKNLKIEKEYKGRNDPVIAFKKSRFMEEEEAANAKLESKEFVKLLSYMPNLKTLDLCNSKSYSAYMEVLRDDVDIELLKFVEQIPKRTDNWYVRDDSLYFSVCYKFRQTLTCMALQHIKTVYSLNDVSGTCVYFLPSFTNLTDVTIHNDDEDLTLFDLLETCPNLINLKYVCNYMEGIDDDSDGMDTRTTAPRYYSNYLKTLNLRLPSLTEPYLSYLTNYPTGTLNTLHISMTDVEFYNWIYVNGLEAIMEFGRRLRLIKDIRIYTNPDDEERRVEMDESKINIFFRLLNAVQGERNLYCRGMFSELKSNEIVISVANNTYMSFQYGLDESDYFMDADQEEIEQDFNLPLPNKDITKIGLEIINSLEFIIVDRVIAVPSDVLQYGFDNCPHLDSFQVNCINSNLKFVAGKPTQYRRNNKRSNELCTQQELYKVKIDGDGLTQSLIDILSKYLPDLKTLISLAGFAYQRDIVDHLLKININLSAFKNLNGFYYDISSIVYNDFNHKFAQLDFTDCDEKYFYEINETETITEGKNTKYVTKFTPTTADFVADCQQDKLLRISVINLKCNTINEIAFLRSFHAIAEFHNGRYESLSISSTSTLDRVFYW